MKLLPATAVAAILVLAAVGSAARADDANPPAGGLAVCTPETATQDAAAADEQGQHGPDGDCDMQEGPDQPDQLDQNGGSDVKEPAGSKNDQNEGPAGQVGNGDTGQLGGNGQPGQTGHDTQQDGEFEGDF